MTHRRGLARVCLVVGALLAGCSPPPLAAPERATSTPAELPRAAAASDRPTGTVTVAYPSEPASLRAAPGADVAADDLAVLWGLPLLRIDDAGQLRRALVDDWEVLGTADPGWQVRLALRQGDWSDGTAVDAADVVATLQARVAADPARFGVITDVAAAGRGTVMVTFDRPYASWADLLVEAGTMRPSEAVGGDASDGDAPVSGGWFRVAEVESGLRVAFEAHPDGPLGPPSLERIEVLFTPSYETALGLLEDDRVDVLLGYLPLNGVARAAELDGVSAASPLGGTTVSLQFRAGGVLGGAELAERRRGVVETVDVDELVEGMLGPNGEPATTPWPGVGLPADPPVGEVREGQAFVLLFPSGREVLGFTARAVQRDLTSRGMSVDMVGEPAPRHAQVLGTDRDVALSVRRSPPRPSLAPWVDDVPVAHEAGAAPVGTAAANEGLSAVAETARLAPLFRMGVLHAWQDVDGIRPSAWVGAGFWNAGKWSVDEAD